MELKDEVVFDYLKGVYNTILYRDIIKRHDLRNSVFLENLTHFLADNTGQLFSAKNISDYLKSQMAKVPVSQVINYLRYLAEAYMIRCVRRMEVSGKKIFMDDIRVNSRNGIKHVRLGDFLSSRIDFSALGGVP